MKQAFRLIAAGLLLASIAQAGLGVRAGVAVSGLMASDKEFRPYLGYEVGYLQNIGYPQYGPQLSLTWESRLHNFLVLRPELGFTQRGYILNQIALYDAFYKVRISYLELPFLLRAGVPRGRIRPGVLLGPYGAVRLFAEGRLALRGAVETRRLSTVAGFDYGLVLGLDTEVPTGRGRLTFDARLNWGLADVMIPDPRFTELYGPSGRVQVIALCLATGYHF